MSETSRRTRRQLEGWRRHLGPLALGLVVAGTLSGLAILWLPFSAANQWNVVVHTLVGLILVPPALWYVGSHWKAYRDAPLSHVKLTGYFALVTILLLVASGLVLTVQSAFGRRIGAAWDVVHIVATFGALAAIAPHLIALVARSALGRSDEAAALRAAQRAYARRAALWVVGSFVPVAVLVGVYDEPELDDRLPEDYSFLYGEDRPFAPSLARTATNQAYDPRSLAGSESCGTAGCHEQILEEWRTSAHRYSAMDPGFRTIQATMGQQNGPESTRYCAGCHDPISLFAGTKNLFVDELTNAQGLDEGVSCVTCHSIQETDVQGNANYLIRQPVRYVYELEPEGAGRFVRDFVIRAYPDQHTESFSKRLFKSPEYCAACHKQF
ncbi:MAG TPA: multiheme c-type cytochrome, partial [Longimicrobiales bacterium]|nr:multiheme c-type cytochrome [Longimicrobiales bacterium]